MVGLMMKKKMSGECCLQWTKVIIISLAMLLPCSVATFDIAKLLSEYPTYSTFTNYLAQTQLAAQINARQAVTVFAVDNTAMAPLAGKSIHHVKNILSLHVALGKLDLHRNETLTVTTLCQDEGVVLKIKNGAVTFVSSANPNGVVAAKLIKPLLSESLKNNNNNSNNISVVKINGLIRRSNPEFLIPVKSPVPVISPVPIINPIPVKSPVPVISPVPVLSPVPTPTPILTPVPADILSPVPVISPVPVNSPVPVLVPVPVISPVPVVSPVPVISPVPIITPVPVNPPAPVGEPVIPMSPPAPVGSPASPVPAVSPVAGPGDSPAGSGDGSSGSPSPADGGSDGAEAKSGVVLFGLNWSLAYFACFLLFTLHEF